MIKPENVQDEAAKKEYENKKFRTFLKCNADENELDQQFQNLESLKVIVYHEAASMKAL